MLRSAILIVVGAIAYPALANDNNSVLAWAKRNAGKYITEVTPNDSIKLGATVTLRARLHPEYEMGWLERYDAERGVAIVSDLLPPRFLIFTMHENCRKVGSFQAQNSYGAKTTVREDACEKFMLRTLNERINVASEIPMTADQYRRLKTTWVPIDIEVELGTHDQKLAESADVLQRGTVAEPVQSRVRSWTVYGTVKRVTMILKGGTVVPIWSK